MTFDNYYKNICDVVASNSKCLSRKIGAIIVKDKSIISTGYNGPPRGIPHCGERYFLDVNYSNLLIEKFGKDYIHTNIRDTCPRQVLGYKSGEGLELCQAGHAERNALINSARNGIAVKDCIIYMNCPIPCKDCLIEIINAGIIEIVCTNLTYYDKVSEYIVQQSDLKIRTFDVEII